MLQSFRRWMRDLHLSDPVTHQQAMLLQILLIGMLLTVILAIVLNIVVFGSAALTLRGLGPNAAVMICIGGALAVLRRGLFRLSVGIVIVVLLIGQAYALLGGGVQHNPGQLLVFTIPIVLAGLLLGRRALIATAAVSILITIAAIVIERLGLLLGEPPTIPVGGTLVLFVLIVGLLGLFLDRFSSAFYSALASATNLAEDNARLYRLAQEHQARLQATLASIGDAVIATDSRGQITFMNSVAESLTGWPESEAVEQHLDNVFAIANEETRQPVESPVARVLREGAVVGLANHTVLLARDGRRIPIDDSGAPIRNSVGELVGVVLVFHDISERRRAEDALHEREMLFQTMADSAPVLLWVSGADMLRTFFNQPWLDFTGRTIEQELGDGWAQGVHPDDYQRYLEIYTSSFQQRHPFSVDYRLRRADGEYRWVLDNGAPRWTPDGVFAGYIGSCIDITERKEAEDRQHLLAEITAQLNDSLDYDRTLRQMVELFVPQFADYCLLHVIEEPGEYRQAAAAHVNPNKQPLLEQFGRLQQSGSDAGSDLILQVLKTGRPLLISRMGLLTPDPTNTDLLRIYRALDPVSLLIVPLVARGQVHGALTLGTSESGRQYNRRDLSFVEDLASRCALALDNAGLYREAQRAIVVRDQFLAIASHELKTPLTAMLGYTRLLQRRNERERILSERDTRALTTIATQSARLEGLVNLLLDLSRIETGHLELETAPLDLVGLVRRLVEDLQPSLDQHSVTLIAPGGPLIVEGDELRLEQVIQNLLQNAIKYSPSGGAVTVQVERNGDLASIAVTDEGIGIPASAIPNLFRRFYRAPNVNPLHISGTGIGLYVVRETVTHHGGTIEVTSTEGVGSTFRVTLPLRAGESSDGATE